MKNHFVVDGDLTRIFVPWKDRLLETLIDTSDLEKVMSYDCRWFARWMPRQGVYYIRSYHYLNRKRTNLYLHRLVVDAPPGMVVDHINHNTLDNRKSNLRIVTNAENLQNTRGAQKNSTTGIRGVSWHKKQKKWEAQLRVNNRQIHVGYFDDIRDAERAVKHARAVLMPFSQDAAELHV
ncbi:hypothetical protein GCM10025857_15250 [Alicyclobacillus contaminans]|uniref:HNH endonuclease n=1 Tax=Alicyclobacillus contaminans TaxID=392016 RepID=UPI000686762E|nr:HNH endonuclease [Alicyclobacillus contaminans]GMA50168.1 hypothetical protein GCM10025857_15250 [Alicyclobacillus contaminans]